MAKRIPPTINEIVTRFDEKKRVYVSAAEQTALIKHLRACTAVHVSFRKLCYDFVTCGLFSRQDNLRERANKTIGDLQKLERIDDEESNV